MEGLKIKESCCELKSVKNLCIISFLLAIALVMKLIGVIKITSYIHVGFGFLVFIIVGAMFGPAVAAIFGLLCDILGFCLVNTGGASFHLGFTMSSVLGALIYGLFLYKLRLGIVRVILVQIVHDLIIYCVLNTLWLSQMYFNNDFGKAFLLRLPKECITLVVNSVLAVYLGIMLKRVVKALKIKI